MVWAMTATRATRAQTTILLLALVASLQTAPAAAQQTDVLRLPFPSYDGGLTPYTFELGYPLVTLVYDTLMWRDADGVPQPWLAQSVTRSRGGRRVTVRLRSGARWHDGRAVTAQDVAFTLRYMAARRHPRFSPQLADISRVSATGRLTARIDLRRPSLGFEDQPLADVPILPSHLWRDLPAGRRAPSGLAVGSGPYRLTRASRKGGYVLKAERGHFKGPPRVGEIRVPILGDAEKTYDALNRRSVDMVPLSLPRQAAGRLDSALGITVRRGTSYTGTALVLNARRRPFARAAARRAVSDSLDLGRIARNVAPAEPAVQGFLHPASRWAPSARVHAADVPAAQKTFGELALERIRVLAPDNDPVRSEAGRQVVLALRRAGATATLVELSPKALGKALGEEGGTPDFDAAITSTPPLVSQDPDYLRAMFGSDPATAPLNVSGYRSKAFDAAAARVAAAAERPAREEAILAELTLLERDAPEIPLFFSQGAFAFRDAIYNGWTFIPGTGILDKRSFLPGATGARPDRVVDAAPAQVGGDDESGFGFTVVNAISLLALLAVLGLAGLAIRQWLSGRR